MNAAGVLARVELETRVTGLTARVSVVLERLIAIPGIFDVLIQVN
jgi:hypothetical protein